MTACLEVLRHLESGSPLPEPLASHLASCPACQALVASWPEVRQAGAAVRSAPAPPELVQRLAAMPRLPQPCEVAVARMGAVLDEEATDEERELLAAHLGSCQPCRVSWEVLASCKQLGRETKPPGALLPRLAAVALPRIAPAARRARMAAAVLYIVAGTLVLASGNQQWLGRQAAQKVETALFYGKAAVANRLRWAEKQARTWLDHTQRVARESLAKAFELWRATLGTSPQNPTPEKRVSQHEEEGRS